MADRFLDTALTMFKDAETLHHNQAYRNACYLYGYVTECFLKTALETAGSLPRFTHDLLKLGTLVESVRVASSSPVNRYLRPSTISPMSQQVPGAELHWDPKHRYDGSRWNQVACKDYQVEAKANYETLLQMQLDGVIQ